MDRKLSTDESIMSHFERSRVEDEALQGPQESAEPGDYSLSVR